jgi:mannosyl-3-phosphoglycerate phosphatase
MNLLVFTDLDGTLLDHGDYSWEAAKTGLEMIRRGNIPLIFTTSKTRCEIERLQAELGIHEPFIPENGAAVYFPDDYRFFKIDQGFRHAPYTVVELGAAYSEIRRFVYAVKERFHLKGFGDLSVEEIRQLTGLSQHQSLMAKKREYTEPFFIEDESRIDELASIAASRGFQITEGGRFFHMIGSQQDKGRAVRICTEIFDKNMDGGIITVGLGDSANDISLLKRVDIPILLPHEDGTYEPIDIQGLIKAVQPGSRGWNDAILQVVDRLDESKTTSIDRSCSGAVKGNSTRDPLEGRNLK